MKCLLEDYAGTDVTGEHLDVEAASALDSILRRIQSSHSTILTLKQDHRKLIIGASEGSFEVILEDAEKGFFQKTTERVGEGIINFVEGGQGVELPFKHALNLAEAKAAAREFFQTGNVDLGKGWE